MKVLRFALREGWIFAPGPPPPASGSAASKSALAAASSNLADVDSKRACGRLTRAAGLVLEAVGLRMPVGSDCLIELPAGQHSHGGPRTAEAEVVGFGADRLYLMPQSDVAGLVPGARVWATLPPPGAQAIGSKRVPVGDNLLGRVVDARGRVLDGRALKKQVIGYGERTMNEIVEAYVNPDLPPEEWDLDQLTGKVKEFIYLLEDLTPEQVQGLGMDELKAFLQEQLRNAYDIKEGQVEQQRPGLMREAERIARDEHRSKKLAVISGVGTRHYYRKLGYELEGPYMVKSLR